MNKKIVLLMVLSSVTLGAQENVLQTHRIENEAIRHTALTFFAATWGMVKQSDYLFNVIYRILSAKRKSRLTLKIDTLASLIALSSYVYGQYKMNELLLKNNTLLSEVSIKKEAQRHAAWTIARAALTTAGYIAFNIGLNFLPSVKNQVMQSMLNYSDWLVLGTFAYCEYQSNKKWLNSLGVNKCTAITQEVPQQDIYTPEYFTV